MICLGINASRARSGGAIAHIRGVIGELDPARNAVSSVHIWGHNALLAQLPNRPWLIPYSTGGWQRSFALELFWEKFLLPSLARKAGVDVLFNVDAGSICRFYPAVTMSQDMLSFEPGEMERYPFGRERARLIALRHVQTSALRNADGAIFLTEYAARRIQQVAGTLSCSEIIPHGIDDEFRLVKHHSAWPVAGERPIRCVYVSNAAPYKHQWHVVEAVAGLRAGGRDIELHLIGGGKGRSRDRLDCQIAKYDPARRFVRQYEFVAHREVPQILAAADLFLFASSCENLPITLLEAMAAGLPIACSDRGPMPDVLGDAGVFFDPEDPASIGKALATLLDDRTIRKKSAERSRKRAEQYTWRNCADRTALFMNEVVKRAQLKATTE
jgi:glycosyltransferase involved in cell wall biosynthesis